MKRLFQIFGGGLGWSLGGPIGAILGVALANSLHHRMEDNNSSRLRSSFSSSKSTSSAPSDFHLALLVLAARVIKADGKVAQQELDFVRAQFVSMFGRERANESFQIFRKIVDERIPLTKVCNQINGFTNHSTRLQLLHFLFKLGLADGHLHQNEIEEIRRIARNLRISSYDFESIRAMFAKETDEDWAFKVLEVSQKASESEVKKAYRKMALKYHPDRTIDVGPEAQESAKETFLNVQKAYEHIQTIKGWS